MKKKTIFKIDVPRKREVSKLAGIVMNALVVPPTEQKYLRELFDILGNDKLRVVRANGEIAGGLGIIPMGHFFGGKSIPCGGITLVGVAPQWRGKGAASSLMESTVREMYSDGFALSSLHAATETLYRKSGYERAIMRYIYELDLQDIGIKDRECEIAPVKKGATRRHKDTYLEFARHANGCLDRHSSIWDWRHNPRGRVAHRYFVKNKGRVEGYVVFFQERKGREASIWILDYCALTGAAGRRILTFFADHGTMAQKIGWAGGPNDMLLDLLPEKKHKVTLVSEVMLRILSVPDALKKRGYPAGLSAEVHFKVHDGIIDANDGDFVLEVSNGKGGVKKGGKGSVRLDVNSLAQLYAGRFSAYELQMLGRLKAGKKELDTLAGLFAGPVPWLSDMF